ncbi:MAG TPA: porin, partial [Phycisphaerales bacterium]|nr:porin [Phycisphaerales bacterium]
RLQAAGTVLDPNLRFRIEGEFSRTSGEFGLLDAWSSYTFTDGWLEGATIRGGQFKMPLLREQLVPDTAALTMERSVVDSVFSQGRSQGVDARWQDDRIRLTGGLGDGIGSLNTRYTSSSESDVALTGRMEFKWGDGDWVRFEDSPGWKLSPYAGMAGVAFHWQHSGNTATPGSGSPGPVSQSDLLMYTADVTSEGDGWSVFASFVGSHLSGDNGAPGFDDFGLVAQGAMFLTGQDEVFVRWDTVFPDGNRTGNDPFNTLTAGYNHFFVPESHALKFTADVCWFLDSTTSNSLVAARLNGRNGLLADSEGNQFCVRFQLQMMF